MPVVHVAGAELNCYRNQEIDLVEEVLLERIRDAQVHIIGKTDLRFLTSCILGMIKYFFSGLILSA